MSTEYRSLIVVGYTYDQMVEIIKRKVGEYDDFMDEYEALGFESFASYRDCDEEDKIYGSIVVNSPGYGYREIDLIEVNNKVHVMENRLKCDFVTTPRVYLLVDCW